MISFTEYLLVESTMGYLKTIVDDVIDQFAEEQRWNTDEILQVVRDRLMTIPEFRDDPRYMKSAMAAVEHYITS